MKKTLYLFRHGETDWNKVRRMQGGTDIPLNETGRAQAQRLREFFIRQPVEVFLSSDLDRAHETARIAAGTSGVPIILDARLRETNLGDAEGMFVHDVDARFGEGAMDQWHRSEVEALQFRFPNGETKAEHLARVLAGITEFLQTQPYRKIGVASHGGAIRRLIHHIEPHRATPILVGNCEVFRVDYDGKTWILKDPCSGDLFETD